jgi:hypothetical protein
VSRGIAITLVQVANAAANPAMTQDTSKQVSQIVKLTCGAAAQKCTRLLPDAPLQSAAFTVPTGQTLVVTNIEFESVDKLMQLLPVDSHEIQIKARLTMCQAPVCF